MWTVDHESVQAVRHRMFTSSGGDFLADLTLSVAPDLTQSGVLFENAVTDAKALDFVPYVEQGVRQFAEEREAERRPVGYLRVTLRAITIQLVDAKGRRFAEAAIMALQRAFESGSVWLE